jgi:protein-export membrane protein SecD
MRKREKIFSRKRAIWWLILIIAISFAGFVFDYQKFDFLPNWAKVPFRLGLDLKGGAHLLYEIDMEKIEVKDKDSVASGLRDVIERRVNLFGVSEPRVETIQVGEDYRLAVELAGVKDIEQAIKMIGETPYLEFREQRNEEETKMILEEIEKENEEYYYEDPYFIPSTPNLTGKYLKSASLEFDQNTFEPLVSLQFTNEGANIFAQLTKENLQKPIAIYLDGQLISAPVVQDEITSGKAQITGKFTVEEAKKLVERLNAGALPAPIKLISQQKIGASLGGESLNLILKAGIIGIIIVSLFMIFYYHIFGIFAVFSLAIYTILSLAIFKLIPVTLTLAGVAGFVLSIGMAVDANILIFERTKEEIKKGLEKTKAIEEGFKRAWLSIRDSNVSTIITCLVLYNFTTSIVKGFALTLLIGVLISMFTAITITKSFLKVFVRGKKEE